ncbi:hypothetical protein FA13DRAFT_308124 [Coprinellus micaceus]|uniref:F-box domain-containing protein n=1 Tax=Coprinellus micaceus TaxID=71717 RepID=A0A4Y7TC96_COPMI|nr:hypothetical protein FA13DRAFT_308124 [Coprinellus micaceus]
MSSSSTRAARHLRSLASITGVLRGSSSPGSHPREATDSISELPLDILIEILSQLHPGAILRLSRTTKSFRRFIMNRTLARASVWVPALKAVNRLPPCPEHIPEPRYVYVMFCEALCDVSMDGGITVSLRNV